MKRMLFALPLVCMPVACAVNPYSAVKVTTDRTSFVGETSDAFADEGEFTVTSPKGITCNGTFSFLKETNGTGTISCSDKRSGTFSFIAQEPKAENHEVILKGLGEFKDGQKFIITFGKADNKEKYRKAKYEEEQPIYEGKPPAYNGQFEFDI